MKNPQRMAAALGFDLRPPAAPQPAPETDPAILEAAAQRAARASALAEARRAHRADPTPERTQVVAAAEAAYAGARGAVSGLQIRRAVVGGVVPAADAPAASPGAAAPSTFAPSPGAQRPPPELPPLAPPGAPVAERLRAIEARIEATRAERERVAAETARAEERTALGRALSQMGVAGPRAAAVAALLNERGAVRRDPAGRIVLAVDRGGYADEYELRTGLDEWARTPEGRELMQPRDEGEAQAPAEARAPRPGERLLAALRGEG